VGAVAHYLEEAGLPTTTISLVREHTVQMRPPRALWVSFELGRPLGVPGDAPFQRRVVEAALALLERRDGPVILQDYAEDAPDGLAIETYEGAACPISLPKPDPGPVSDLAKRVLAEIGRLSPWYQLALEGSGRTMVGISGLKIEELVRFLSALAEGETENPRQPERELGERMRDATEDLRNWYLEAAGARPGGAASSRALADWYWGETAAGALCLELYGVCATSEDASVREVAALYLVPRAQRHRLK